MSSAHSVVVPVVDLDQNNNPYHKVVVKGVSQVQPALISSDSHSTTQTIFNFQPPSQNTVIDRRIYLQAVVTATLTGGNTWESGSTPAGASGSNYAIPRTSCKFDTATASRGDVTATLINDAAAGHRAVLDNVFAPRQLPLHSGISVIDLEVNGTHISVSPSDYLHELMKYTSSEFRSKYLTESPSYPDTEAGYDLSYGKDDHCLGVMGNVGRHGEQPRGAFGSSGNGTTVLTYTFTEPLMISPLLIAGQYEGLSNINKLSVTIRWSADLLRMFSAVLPAKMTGTFGRATTNMVSAAGANLNVAVSSANLLVNYYTPQSDIQIPNQIVLPYTQPQFFSKVFSGANVTASGDTASLQSDSLRLSQIPERMYVFARKNQSSKDINDADCSFEPNTINITWENQVGIMSGVSGQQLFRISRDNGLDSSFADCGFNGTSRQDVIGAPMCFVFGKDIPLRDGQTAGQRGSYTLQLSYTGRNTTSATVSDVELCVLIINSGAVVVAPNSCLLTLGNIDAGDVVNAEHHGVEYKDLEQDSLGLGGGWFSKLSHLAKKGYHYGKKAHQAYKAGSKAVKDVRGALGRGEVGGQELGGGKVGGAYRSRRR